MDPPPPMQPQPPPPMQQPPPQPMPVYQPVQQQPLYVQPAPPPLRNGLTVETNLGIGWITGRDDNGQSDTTDVGFGGLTLGIGGWVGPQMAITARIAGVTVSKDSVTFSHIFFGPSLQYWIDDHIWLGGGVGLSIARVAFDGASDSTNGFGLDLRAGYTFTTGSENTFNVSVELNPGHYSENGASTTLTGIAFMVGYQHL
jgi:hypothetical protein